MELEGFRAFLREWLQRNGWNVPRLARATKVADPVIRRWLSNEPKRPSDANLRKLAPIVGMPEEQLLRMCGYLPGEVGAIAESDPDLAEISAAWKDLDDWRRKAIKALASGVGALTICNAPTHAAA